MPHIGGPALDPFDALGTVVKRVEQGSAPDSILATGSDFPGRCRPLRAAPKRDLTDPAIRQTPPVLGRILP